MCCDWPAEALHCSHSQSPSERSPAPRPSAQHPDEPAASCAALRGADRLRGSLFPQMPVQEDSERRTVLLLDGLAEHELTFVEDDTHGWLVPGRDVWTGPFGQGHKLAEQHFRSAWRHSFFDPAGLHRLPTPTPQARGEMCALTPQQLMTAITSPTFAGMSRGEGGRKKQLALAASFVESLCEMEREHAGWRGGAAAATLFSIQNS